MEKKNNPIYNSCMHFVGGTLGGMSGVLASYPLDTIKIRMQTQDISKIYYKNSLDCVKQMYKKDGIKVFYRGIEAPLLTYGIIKSITFGSYGNLLDYYKQKRIQNNTWNNKHTYGELFTAGCFGGFMCTFVMTPNDRVKIQMQTLDKNGNKLYNSTYECFKDVLKNKGVFGKDGLYKGWTSTVMRDVPGMSGYYLTYEVLLRNWRGWNKDGSHNKIQNLICGGIAGQVSWLPVYPIDIIKSRIQSLKETSGDKQIKNIDIFKTIAKKDGIRGLYRGFGPTLIQAFPLHGTIFMVYELWKDVMKL